MKLKLFLSFLFLSLATVSKAAFINDAAPGFTLTDMNGKTQSLKDYQGKLVFVNFWASWCPPCKMEFPELSEFANEYKDQGLVVLAVNLDKSQAHVQKFLEKMEVKPEALHILLDPDAKVVADYVARSMPSSFVIDKKGVIRFVHFGFSPKDPAKWRTEIDGLLSEQKK